MFDTGSNSSRVRRLLKAAMPVPPPPNGGSSMAFRRSSLLLLLVAVLMASTVLFVHDSRPASADHGDIWSATLTVKDITNTDFGDFGLGCHLSGQSFSCGEATRAETHFTYEGTTYTVQVISLLSGNLAFTVDQAIPNGIKQNATLHVDGTAFSFADASYPLAEGGLQAVWSNTGLSWAEGDTVQMSIVIDTGLAPHAPANVSLYPSGDGSYLIVSWAAPDPENDPQVTFYDVEYKLSTDTTWTDAGYDPHPNPYGDPMPPPTYWVLSGLTIGSTYDARVRAKNDSGDSAWSSTAQGTLSATTKDNNLSGLTLTAAASATGTFTGVNLLSPFRPTTTYYYAVVDDAYTHVKVTPTTRHTGASVTVNGTSVNSGSPSSAIAFKKEILIEVTAAYHSSHTPWPTRTYTLHLVRNIGGI